MKCPQCGTWTKVLETRGEHRRRECANLHIFHTMECVTDQTGPFYTIRNAQRAKSRRTSTVPHTNPNTNKPKP